MENRIGLTKDLKDKLSKDAYIAALEAENNALESVIEINAKYSGDTALPLIASTFAVLSQQIIQISLADKERNK